MSVYVIGDSLSSSTHGPAAKQVMLAEGWTVESLYGRPLYSSMELIRAGADTEPDVMILALGSNDVNQERNNMAVCIRRALSICRNVPYTYITTVKVNGVNSFYGRQWKQYARKWNNAARTSDALVLDWNAKCQGHPGWFLADGLHMTNAGQTNYGHFMVKKIGGRG